MNPNEIDKKQRDSMLAQIQLLEAVNKKLGSDAIVTSGPPLVEASCQIRQNALAIGQLWG